MSKRKRDVQQSQRLREWLEAGSEHKFLGAEAWRFCAAVISAAQGNKKSHAEMLAMLRADYPLTADDKLVLAHFLGGKFKRQRGEQKHLAGPAHWRREAVKRVREILKTEEGATEEQEIERACMMEMARRQASAPRPLDDERLEVETEEFAQQIRNDLKRSPKRRAE